MNSKFLVLVGIIAFSFPVWAKTPTRDLTPQEKRDTIEDLLKDLDEPARLQVFSTCLTPAQKKSIPLFYDEVPAGLLGFDPWTASGLPRVLILQKGSASQSPRYVGLDLSTISATSSLKTILPTRTTQTVKPKKGQSRDRIPKGLINTTVDGGLSEQTLSFPATATKPIYLPPVLILKAPTSATESARYVAPKASYASMSAREFYELVGIKVNSQGASYRKN